MLVLAKFVNQKLHNADIMLWDMWGSPSSQVTEAPPVTEVTGVKEAREMYYITTPAARYFGPEHLHPKTPGSLDLMMILR